MKTVKIVVVRSSSDAVTASGEVQASDVPGSPPIAHRTITRAGGDTFQATPGRYSFHFSVDRRCTLTLSTEINGVPVGPPEDINAMELTTEHRYHFGVPS